MTQKMKKIMIGCTMLVLVLLLGGAVFLLNRDHAKEGIQEANNTLGIDWYDEQETEFTISTAEELFDLAKLSYYYDFKGQTIKLGADIVVNEGNAADWATEMPEHVWESIYGFAGTFDGQGHTISGLYSIGTLYFANIARIAGTDYVTSALFRSTREECVIKNFKLVNSYFESDLDYGVASISSNGGGTFDSIYSDVIIVSQKSYVGGIIGKVSENAKITNCWYDGEINVIKNYGRYTGGIVGRTMEDVECTIEHCLVSATMNNDLYKRGVNMGGILGQSLESKVTISDCLMSGKMNNEWVIVGSAVGNVATKSEVTISDVYVCSDSFKTAIGVIEKGKLIGLPVVYDREMITGQGGYELTTLDFQNYWAAVENGTPVLKAFATETLNLDGVAKKVDASWYNKDENTYVLNDAADFRGFALLSNFTDFEGKTIKLAADVTINEGKASRWEKEAPAIDWRCIGSENLPFKGTFDGQMHTISGIYLKTDESYSGLFGITEQEAVVKNFKLKNSYFETSAPSFGSIAGRGVGTYDTIYSNAIVVSSNCNVAGLIGQVTAKEKGKSLKMSNCWFDGSVKNTGNKPASRRTAGLLGFVILDAHVSNCLNTGTVDVSAYSATNSATSKTVQPQAGGLLGYINDNITVTLKDCMNVGEVKYNKAATSGYGSVLGVAAGKTVLDNVYATKESCKTVSAGRGVDGVAIVYEKDKLMGYGGYEWTTLNFKKYWAVVPEGTSILRSFAKKVPSLNGVARMVDTSWYDKKADTYILMDVADLYGLAILSNSVDFEGKTIKLGADITVNTGNASEWGTTAPAYEWNGIGTSSCPFKGTFDGQMHTVSGLYMNTEESYGGFFRMTEKEAVVKNFKLTNTYFESSAASLGSIAGRGSGTYDTVYSDAIVVSSNCNVGGLIGQVSAQKADASLKMKNCWFDGSVLNTGNTTAKRKTGGLFGVVIVNTKIQNCLNTGTIDAPNYTVTNSSNSKTVQPIVGGFAGHVNNTCEMVITDCINVGTISCNKAATSAYGSVVGLASGTTTINNTYVTKESCAAQIAGNSKGYTFVYDEEKLTGYKGYQWTTLDFENAWAVSLTGTPVIKAFATDIPELNVARVIDISWYEEDKNTYVLSDAKDLYGLALLSRNTDFAGKSIELSEDIDLNPDWTAGSGAAEHNWEGIGSTTLRFAGKFNGNKHTISGLYMSANGQYAGLFNGTDKNAEIGNFRLTNSYLYSEYDQLGSVVGNGQGKFYDIYSDAIIESTAYNVGGIVGCTSSEAGVNLVNCWFDGSVSNTTIAKNGYGGMIGKIQCASTITSCLNTGTISLTVSVTPAVAGLVGQADYAIDISDSVNAGDIVYNENAKERYASFVGYLQANANISNSYAVKQGTVPAVYTKKDSYKENVSVGSVAEEYLTGTDAYAQTANLNYDNSWLLVSKHVPVQKCFKDCLANPVIEVDTTWYDKKGDYELKDIEDFFGFALLSQRAEVNGFKNATITLTADITFNEDSRYGADKEKNTADDWSATVAPTYEWGAIGNTTQKFNGTFDGKDSKGVMHTINGLYMNNNLQCQGLFSDTGVDAKIQNFSLLNSYIYNNNGHGSASMVGSIAGRAQGEIDTVYSDAIVVSTGYDIGGLIGRAGKDSGLVMNNCWFDGLVSNTTIAKNNYGGLIGKIDKASTITNSLNTGAVSLTVSKTPQVGGLIGHVAQAVTVKNCLNAGQINYNASATGRFAGIAYAKAALTISDTYMVTQGTLKAVDVSSASYANNAVVNVLGATDMEGTNALTNMSNLFTTKTEDGKYESYWAVVPGGHPILSAFGQYEEKGFLAIDASWYDGSGNYEIEDASDLYGLALLSQKKEINGFNGAKIKLTKDIQINAGTPNGADGENGTEDDWSKDVAPDYNWIAIGDASGKAPRFAGTFDGKDSKGVIHTISGLYMNTTSKYQGLFGGTAASAMIQNFRLEDSYFHSTAEQLGSVVGNAMGKFHTIYSNAIVEGSASASKSYGGFIGSTSSGGGVEMSNCWFDGAVSNIAQATNYYGGLIGLVYNTSTVSNCLNTGKISLTMSKTPRVGGLVGAVYQFGSRKQLTITNSCNMGEIKLHANVNTFYGLLVGGKEHASDVITISNSYAVKQDGIKLVYGAEDANFAKSSVVNKTTITPENTAETKMPELFNGDSKQYWAVDTKTGLPILSSFVKP